VADAAPLAPNWVFHHVGYACAGLAAAARPFEALGYQAERPAFEDTTQGVRGLFLVGPGPRVELLENLVGRNTLTPWLDQGVKIYHFAYEVPDMPEALAWARAQRAVVTVQPVPAVAFDNRPIAFVMLRTGFMLEFIQAP
jgi:methylmalonyl-CoA/ethylmalonyl-CoA epimerase